MGYYSIMKNGKRYQVDPEKAREMKRKWRKGAECGKHTPRAYEDWEDELILQHQVTDRELAKVLNRSIQAIYTRRCKLRKMQKVRR